MEVTEGVKIKLEGAGLLRETDVLLNMRNRFYTSWFKRVVYLLIFLSGCKNVNFYLFQRHKKQMFPHISRFLMRHFLAF